VRRVGSDRRHAKEVRCVGSDRWHAQEVRRVSSGQRHGVGRAQHVRRVYNGRFVLFVV
jgi:hypothetical protein